MTVGRKLKRNVFIDTDIDCQNCGCWQRVCTWNGECDNLEPMTNEEWFASLPTEEKAKVLRRRTYGNGEDNEREEKGWVNWLKAKHEDNPPDIPSVPSWDRWLQGEKTKCEFCDGTNVGCNLVGRFECPKTPKTKQEYLQTCNTEQLAEWITDKINAKLRMALHDAELYPDDINENEYMENENEWVEWLKQPHQD